MKRKIFAAVAAGAFVISAAAGCAPYKPTLTLEKRNGEAADKIAVVRGDCTYKSGSMLMPNPTRDGYFFDGWYLDEQCTQSAYGVHIFNDVTFYAGWTDTYTVPDYMPSWLFKSYGELFAVTAKAEPVRILGEDFVSILKLTLSVTPTGDFTGGKSTDRFELQLTYSWLSDEKFMGEYVSDEVQAYIYTRDVWLDKEHGYSLQDEVIYIEFNNSYLDKPIYESTFANERTQIVIDYIFEEPILQYKH